MNSLGAANELLQIVSHIASNPSTEFAREGFRDSVTALQWDAYKNGSQSLDLELGKKPVPWSTPTMSMVLDLANRFHVPAVNILLGDVSGTNFDLLETYGLSKNARKSIHRNPWRDRRVVEAEARAYFNTLDGGWHPSLAAVARHVHMSPSGLQYLCERLAINIVATYRREIVLRRDELGRSLAKRVCELITFHSEKGQVKPGKKELVNLLLTEGRWPKNLIREAVRQAFEISEKK